MGKKASTTKKRSTKPLSPEQQIAILQEILWLTRGELESFNPTPPSLAIKAFLYRATLSELQGTLVELLAAMRTAQK